MVSQVHFRKVLKVLNVIDVIVYIYALIFSEPGLPVTLPNLFEWNAPSSWTEKVLF